MVKWLDLLAQALDVFGMDAGIYQSSPRRKADQDGQTVELPHQPVTILETKLAGLAMEMKSSRGYRYSKQL